MARVNLLPWREERRKVRNREAQTLFGATGLLAALVVLMIVLQYNRMIEGQQARNQYLRTEIAAVDAKIKEIEGLEKERERLMRRKQIIEELQASRSMMVHLFDDLVRTIPDGVKLNSIKQSGNQLTLQGASESYARISEYMRALEVSKWIGDPEIQIVEAKGSDARSRYAFTLRVTQRKADEATAGGAATIAANAEGGAR
jgi:type IV pilus assembly protein PilN